MARHIVFIAHSAQDVCWKDRLVSHLRVHVQHGLFDVWDESCISPGENRLQATRHALDAASFVVLLITADFLASELFHNEISKRLGMPSRERPQAFFPLLVRPCDWKLVGAIAQLAPYPPMGRFISSGSVDQIDADLAGVASYLRGQVALVGSFTGASPIAQPPVEQEQAVDGMTTTATDDPRRYGHSATESGNPACLAIISESEHGSEHNAGLNWFRLRESASIGRSSESDVVLVGSGVSRAHARLALQGDEWLVHDLNSTCGTYLNYRRVVGSAPLRDGDLIVVGPTLMKFFCGGGAYERMQTEVAGDSVEGVSGARTRRGVWQLICTEYREARLVHGLLVHVSNLSEILRRQGPSAVHMTVGEVARCVRLWLGPALEVSRCGFDRFFVFTFDKDLERMNELVGRVPPRHLIRVGDVGTVVKLRSYPMSLALQGTSDGFWSQVDGWVTG